MAELPDEFFLALDCSLIQQKHTAQKDWSQPSNTSHQWVTICWLAVIKIIKYTKVVQLKLAGEVSIVKSSKEPKGWLHRKVTLHVILYHDIALFHSYLWQIKCRASIWILKYLKCTTLPNCEAAVPNIIFNYDHIHMYLPFFNDTDYSPDLPSAYIKYQKPLFKSIFQWRDPENAVIMQLLELKGKKGLKQIDSTHV